MKRKIGLAVILLLLVGLCGCSKYVSSYKAIGFVHSNESTKAFMSFYEFEGRMVFILKCDDETSIDYNAELKTGNCTVYYDSNGEKTMLFALGAGDHINSSGGELTPGTVYIIVETDEKCMNGDLSFSLE